MLVGEPITQNFNIYIKYCFRELYTMEKNEFLLELLHELSYRSDEGYPILSKQSHIYLISEILDEWGYGEIKNELIQNLTEAGEAKKYSSPALNKVVKYKDRDGNDKEGLVGSLLRLAKDQPGREAAERALPAEGTPEREKINNELGGEGQPNRNIEKEKEDKADVEAGGEQQPAEEPQPGVFAGKGGDEYRANLPKNDSAHVTPNGKSKEEEAKKGNGYNGSKDKTLKDTNPIESENYQMELEPNDVVFEEKNKNNANPTPPEPFKLDNFIKNPKFPKRYIKALERMINSKVTSETAKWTHFSDIEGGAGQISAQAGELMTMMGSTMSDDEWTEFSNALLKHEASLLENHPTVFMKKNAKGKFVDNPSSRIVDKTWVSAATKSRKVILNRLTKQYGEGTTIVASSWDAEGEVESMGMADYKKNKGFSTDMYLRVRKPDGEEVLDEISLKKSKDVNFLNSGAGKFKEWLGDELPDEINQSVYKQNQKESLVSAGNSIRVEVETLLNSDSPKANALRQVFKNKGLDFNKALENLESDKGDYRKSSSVMMACIKALADWPTWGAKGDTGPNNSGNITAQQYLRDASFKQTKFIEESIKALSENPKMKEGMMNSIREEFPLKAVSQGEETMAIGDMSLDKNTMKEIFGTSNYDDIKEKLTSEPGPPPFLGYQAEIGGDIIPIAEVSVREDGVGYGGQIKFEMKLDSRFAKILKTATDKVYNS
jgi:hypothetical protein